MRQNTRPYDAQRGPAALQHAILLVELQGGTAVQYTIVAQRTLTCIGSEMHGKQVQVVQLSVKASVML